MYLCIFVRVFGSGFSLFLILHLIFTTVLRQPNVSFCCQSSQNKALAALWRPLLLHTPINHFVILLQVAFNRFAMHQTTDRPAIHFHSTRALSCLNFSKICVILTLVGLCSSPYIIVPFLYVLTPKQVRTLHLKIIDKVNDLQSLCIFTCVFLT